MKPELRRADAEIVRALASAATLDEALDALLTIIGGHLGWDTGAYWRIDPSRERLVLAKRWTAEGQDFEPFWQDSLARAFGRGDGLPGQAWASGAVVWMPALADEARFPRRPIATAAGLHSGIAFPLTGEGGEAIGVMEFFTRRDARADEGVHLTQTLARELPQFMRRIAAAERIQRSEARLAAMQEAALDAIIWMNAAGVVTGWNAAAERTFGYSASEAVGQPLASLIVPPSLRAAHRAGLQRFLGTRRPTLLNQRVEVTAVDKSQREFPAELIITYVETQSDVHFVGYVRDISERKALERERQQLLAEAQQANRQRDQLLAVVSHDLRNSLNAVVVSGAALQTMLARMAIEDRMVPRTVDTILRAAGQMRHMIGDLLDVATIQSGRLSVALQEEDLASMVAEAIDLHLALAQEKGITIHAQVVGAPRVRADRGRLMQVFSNLLGNSIKFCSQGDIVTVGARVEEDGMVAISVSDTGPGIPPDVLPHIFEPHWAGDVPGKGTGLGLFIARRLIEAHGGTAGAALNDEGGLTVTLRVPRAERTVARS